MRWLALGICGSALIACVGDAPDTSGSADGGSDATTDSGFDAASDTGSSDDASTGCALSTPFDPPVPVMGITSTVDGGDGGPSEDTFPALTSDEHQIIFASNRLSGTTNYDLFFAQRSDPSQPFGAATPLTSLNTAGDERGAAFATGGLTIFFYTNVNGVSYDIQTATRADTSSSTFGVPQVVSGLDTSAVELDPHPTADGSTIYLTKPPNPSRIYRALAASGYSPSPIGELDSVNGSAAPVPTSDDLAIYFSKIDPTGGDQLWYATRSSNTSGYEDFHEVSEVGTGVRPSWISPDNCTLYFWTSGAQTYPESRIYRATRSK